MTPDKPSQSAPFPHGNVPPDLLEWARQTFDEEEFVAQVRDIKATGGLPLDAFIADIEARALGK